MTFNKQLPALLAVALLWSGGAHAQNFFERLFGLAPARPNPPPAAYNTPPSDATVNPDEPKAAPPPRETRPVALRVPTEDGVVGRDLKENGSAGSLRIERDARGELQARMTIVGRRSAQSVETCSISVSGGQPVALSPQGRPDGLQRYQLNAGPSCPLQLDILDEAVLIKGPGEACVFQAANCQADPSGLWGPDPAQLMPRARDFESTRASADKAVRDNYRAMSQRARPESVRPIIAEQAAFSSDRENVCRSYAREGMHSFCNARYSEARAISLAQRLGITYASNAPPANYGTEQARPRGRGRDPYGVQPGTNEPTPEE